MKITRPIPPIELIEGDDRFRDRFCPDAELAAWLRETFIASGAALENPDHRHLQFATIGAVWTNVENSRHGRVVVGQAELGEPRGAMGKWAKARVAQQSHEWFGCIPDFIVTFDAAYSGQCSDAEFCALVEHELYHCGQERDEFGAPKFRKSGKPAFAIRGHDVEEFIGVVKRYGAIGGAADLVKAANSHPEIARVKIAQACGNCLRVAA